MKRALIALAVLCGPATLLAQDASVRCGNIVDAVVEVFEGVNVTVVSAPIIVQDDWCTVASVQVDDFALTDLAFSWAETAELREINIKIAALDIAAHRFEVAATLEHNTDNRALTLQSLSARADDGYGITASGTMILGSSETFAASLAETALQSLSARIFVSPPVLRDLQLDASLVSGAQITGALDGLDFGQMDRQSRRELLRFTGVMPDAQGRLDLTAAAADGVGLAQMVLPFVRVSEADIPAALAAALRGVQVALRWNPGRM